MPNWGAIGRGLLTAAPYIAAPFTGGLSLAAAAPGIMSKIAGVAGAVAPVVGEFAKGRAEGQQRDIGNQQNQSELQQRLFQAILQAQQGQARLGQERAQFERDSPDVRFGQAMRGNLAQNLQDVSLSGGSPRLQKSIVNYGGGLRPSAIGEGGRAAGAQLAGIGSSMMGKDTFNIPDLPQAPQIPGLPQSNWLDKLLGVAGPALGFAGALGPQQQQVAPPVTGQPDETISGITNPDLMRRGLFNPGAPKLRPDGTYDESNAAQDNARFLDPRLRGKVQF